jgi:hypothetical protein
MGLALCVIGGYMATVLLVGWLRGWGCHKRTIHARENIRTVELHRVRRTGRPSQAHN